ncbi:type VI secretion system protein TssA [Yersinia pekkanenii]|uniref:ImpA domain-containing protein n=1 Tax=Yersinia pekkanenii TaxID=1288385 RepID=A0A0T9QQP8_9GAMM|nr:type VI secretion system ImpA family N-terminal domain-containing protein [Yersinia pekkanenii]CNI23592.1 ImpA domain-containing protein [Yersinia pekkanenii]CRY67342.1 ImpA domain-containing protein [Yersinia pekkanenii]
MSDIFPLTLLGVEYDPAYGEIESILSQLDESADPLFRSDEPPYINWHHISELAAKLLEQCSDLRVMVWFIRANIQIKGVFALYDGLMNLNQLVKDDSAVIYPLSDEAPLNSGHAAALGWLATAQCIAEIKATRITAEHSYTLQDIITTALTLSGQERHSITSSSLLITVNNYFKKNGLPDLQEQLSGINGFLEEISCYANQCSEDYQLNCDLLHVFFKNNIFQLSQLNEPLRDDSEFSDKKIRIDEGHEREYLNSNDKKISSRQEVIMMLDRILEYFQCYEPSHPAPMFIYRTKEMIGMDFYSIVEEILPEAVIALKQLAGKNNPPFR